MLSYDDAVLALRGLQGRKWRGGLDRMEALCERLGVPKGGDAKFIHVAGTNGKGSTTSLIQSILVGLGYRTGGYFSPYVYDLRERIQIDGKPIPKEQFARLLSRVLEVGEELESTEFGAISEFEAKTALGFLAWQEAGCEYVALETGLGGRLDSTNVVNPVVSVITSIGYDHMDVLGDTLTEIAGEKAGIIKSGIPVVVGDLPEEAMAVMEARADDLDCSLVHAAEYWEQEEWQKDEDLMYFHTLEGAVEVNIPAFLPGPIQRQNLATALCSLQAILGREFLEDDRTHEAIRWTRVPGRFQVEEQEGRLWILDGAHNGEAAGHLVKAYVESGFEPPLIVLGMLGSHHPGPVLEALAELPSLGIRTVPVNWTKTANPDELADLARPMFATTKSFWSVEEALEDLPSAPILVTGSFYLLNEVARAAGLPVFEE